MHYYQFNIGDYKSHTEHLSDLEDLAYRRMLDWYYLHETPLPKDVEQIARLIRMRSHTDCIAVVLREYFQETPEGWTSRRADLEIEHYRSKVEQASKAGKASAERRRNDRSTDVQPNIKQETITNNQEPVNTKPRERGPDFVLPDWIDRDHWDAWHSTPKRKKATPQQKQLAIKKLQAWRDQGLDYAGALENAATGGYQGLFLPNQTRANANPNKQEALEARNKAVADQWLREQGAIV
jgi:uncharacterized protein YdaU (DUF1376 family)